MSGRLYSDDFYAAQIRGSYASAIEYTRIINHFLAVNSVIDLGCGRGTWLKAFAETGANRLVGLDGAWNCQDKMIDQRIKFVSANLNEPLFNIDEKFDLAMTLEVAEHLQNISSRTFVENLIGLSDAVLFSAAFSNQGGVDHINEQNHSYWAEIFIDHEYHPYDLFRPALWGNDNVQFWYQQNTFLYIKSGSLYEKILNSNNIYRIENYKYLDCVHPKLFNIWVEKSKRPVRSILKGLAYKYLPDRYIKLISS